MSLTLLAAILFLLVLLGVNSVCGFIAYGMAGRRDMRQLPAFFGAFFGSVFVLFYIAMFPVVVKKVQFPKEEDE